MTIDPASATAHRHPLHITATGGPLGDLSGIVTGSRQGDTGQIDVTLTNGSGRVIQDQIDITRNADGTITRDTTRTDGAGNTVSTALTYGPAQQGVRAVSGSVTQADGTIDQVAGTTTRTATGHESSLTLTNAAGQTESQTASFTRSGPTATLDVSRTDFAGQTTEFETSAILSRAGTPVSPG